jgi:hypothetical protein
MPPARLIMPTAYAWRSSTGKAGKIAVSQWDTLSKGHHKKGGRQGNHSISAGLVTRMPKACTWARPHQQTRNHSQTGERLGLVTGRASAHGSGSKRGFGHACPSRTRKSASAEVSCD